MSNGEPPLLTNEGMEGFRDPLMDDPRAVTNENLEAVPDVYESDPQFGEVSYPPNLDVPSDVQAERRSKSLYDLANEALRAGDRLLATGFLDAQREEAAHSQLRVQEAGGDPGRIVAPNAKWTDPSIEQQRQQLLIMQRQAKMRSVLKEHDVGFFQEYRAGVEKEYREKNGAAATRITTDMTEDEKILYAGSLKPVVKDPNEVADLRQRLVKMDIAMKEVDPTASVFTHPETKQFANWIARESNAGSMGFIQSGEQRMDLGEGGAAGAPITMAFAEGVTDFGLNLLYGAVEYSGRFVESVTDGRVGWARPQNFIQGADGKLYTNAGKVPGIVETLAAVRARALGENVKQYVGRVNAARQYEQMQASGVDSVIRGTAGVIGMGWGFGLPAGKAMGIGAGIFKATATRGLQRLSVGAWGPSPLAVGTAFKVSARMEKITGIMAGTAGAMAANGLAEGIAFGNQEGFGKAFYHGMVMAPVLMFFGAVGRKTENALLFRKVADPKAAGGFKLVPRRHMPEKVAAMLSGGLEGIGFGTMEAHQTGALWNFVQDPSPETWQIYVKNVVGFGLFKGMSGRGMIDNPAEMAVRQIARREAIAKFGEELLERRNPLGVTGEGGQGGATQKGEAFMREQQQRLGEKGPEGTQIKGVQPSAEKLMEQASRGELQEPEIITNKEAQEARTRSEEQQGKDPLEAPDFMERPEGERRQIMEAGTPIERRRVAESFEGPERREGERRQEPRTTEQAEQARQEELDQIEREREETFEGRVEQAARAGISEELLMGIGEASKARREALTEADAEAAYQRLQKLQSELDALEARQDPITRRKLQELEDEGLIEREAPMADPEAPGKPRTGMAAGRAPGGSMGPAASPYRTMEATEGIEPIAASDIHATFEGRQAVKGVAMPFLPWGKIKGFKIGEKLGTAVQVAVRAGRIAKRTTLGVFKLFENMTRTKADLDLVVTAHEWSHALMRQQLFGEGGGGRSFVKQAREWMEAQSPEVQADILKILNWYPGANEGRLRKWQYGAEAWAEWFARDLLGDETLYAEVPHLSKVLLEWLGAPAQAHLAGGPKTQYRILQSQLKRYRLQGASAQVDKMSQRGEVEPQGTWYERQSEGLRSAIDKVTKAMYDDMVELKRSQAKWLEISDIREHELDILDNPARMFDAIRMVSAKQAENFLLRGTHTLGFKRKGESLKDILSLPGIKGNRRKFINYIVALRGADLTRKGKTQHLQLETFLYAIKENETPEFIEGAKRLKIWSDALLDLVGEAGNISGADIQRMKDYSIVYIPFVRALSGPKATFGGRGVVERGTGVKATKGSTAEIQDPVKALEDVTRAMITKAHQSMVMKALYKMTLMAEVGGLASVVPRKNVPERYRIDKAFREIQAKLNERLPEFEGEEMPLKEGERGELTEDEILMWKDTFEMMGELLTETGIGDDLITLFGQKAIPYNEADAIVAYTPRLTAEEIAKLPKDNQGEAIRQNGKMLWLQLDVPAYEALMGVDQPVGRGFLDLPIIKQLVGYPVKWTRFFATDANPAFVAANMLRDAMSQPIFDNEGNFIPFSGFYKMAMGAAELIRGGEYAEMYQASGAGVSTFMNEGVRRQMRGEAKTIVGEAIQGVAKAVDTWKRWMAHPESFTRIYEFKKIYQRAKDAGKSDTEAAFQALEAAREITVNFSRGGIATRAMNQMVPYFNASWQGQRKLLRSLTGREGGTPEEVARIQRNAWGNGLVQITAPAMVLWAMFSDEDWYQDLPEWRKRFYFNMKFSDDGPIVSLPKPFEAGLLFATLPEIWADTHAEKNPIALAPTIGEMILPYLRGLGQIIPTFAKPFIENKSGYDFFSDRAITPYWTSRTNPPEEQMRASTSHTAQYIFKEFPKLANLAGAENPIELEHLLGGFTAGAGVTGLRMVDEMLDFKDHPAILPGILAPLSSFYNRFGRQTPHGSSRAVQAMYEYGDKLRAQAGGPLGAMERGILSNINSARQQISQLHKAVATGAMSREDADRLAFEIASRIMQSVR